MELLQGFTHAGTGKIFRFVADELRKTTASASSLAPADTAENLGIDNGRVLTQALLSHAGDQQGNETEQSWRIGFIAGLFDELVKRIKGSLSREDYAAPEFRDLLVKEPAKIELNRQASELIRTALADLHAMMPEARLPECADLNKLKDAIRETTAFARDRKIDTARLTNLKETDVLGTGGLNLSANDLFDIEATLLGSNSGALTHQTTVADVLNLMKPEDQR